MDAGLPPAEALEIYRGGGAAEVAQRIHAGASLHEAMTEQRLLGPAAAALVRAGERSGGVPDALRQVAADLDSAGRQLTALAMACAYPVFLLVAANFIMPFPKLILEGVGAYAAAVIPPLLWVGVPITALTGALWTGRLTWAQLLSPTRRIPGMRAIHVNIAAGRLCRMTGRLLAAGLSVDESLELAGETLPYADQTAAIARARKAIEGGTGLGAALAPTGLLPPETMSVVASAEKAGRLDAALAERADKHGEAAAKGAKVVAAIASTALTVAVVLLIASQILMTYMRILPGIGNFPPELQEMMNDPP